MHVLGGIVIRRCNRGMNITQRLCESSRPMESVGQRRTRPSRNRLQITDLERSPSGRYAAALGICGSVDGRRLADWSRMLRGARARHFTILLTAIVVLRIVGIHAATVRYRIDPAKSRAAIHVGKTGAFSFVAGHTHEVAGPVQSGTVDLDLDTPSESRVALVVSTADLKVQPQGEPEADVPKVQQTMAGEKVLDVTHHPRITYESTAITLNTRHGNVLDATAAGRLTIRDVTHEVTAPVHVELKDGALTATGHLSVKQSAFGITPISVAGVVNVKDALEIDFTIAAAKE
jgi:polyisoprenoid-binding protein YceI